MLEALARIYSLIRICLEHFFQEIQSIWVYPLQLLDLKIYLTGLIGSQDIFVVLARERLLSRQDEKKYYSRREDIAFTSVDGVCFLDCQKKKKKKFEVGEKIYNICLFLILFYIIEKNLGCDIPGCSASLE